MGASRKHCDGRWNFDKGGKSFGQLMDGLL